MISSLLSKFESGFEFSDRRGLLLSTQKAAVYHWHRGQPGGSYLFDVNEEGQAHFERYLKETKNSPFYLLVDVFEEGFRRETIPHVLGPDRAAIIRRRQERLFRNTSYCYHEIQGRETQGRRDDRVLLSAITNAKLIDPWLALLDKYKVPLAGIHSLPLFTGALLALSVQSVSGLRQTFYLDGEFRISRLAPLPRYGAEPYAPYIFREVEKICRYINSLQLQNRNVPVNVYFLASGELLQALEREYKNNAGFRYHSVDLNTLSAPQAPRKTASTPFSDQFFMHNLLARAPRKGYASRANTRYFFMRRLRHLMLAASALLIISSGIWGGSNLLQALSYKQRSLIAQGKAQFYEAHNQAARKRLPKTPVEPASLQLAVELAATLRAHKTRPLQSIRLISKALEQFPAIHLGDVRWAASLEPDVGTGPGGNATSTSEAGLDETGDGLYQVSVINGYIEPFDGNFREAISLINEFADTLSKQEAVYDVSIISLPLDLSSSASLQGDMKASGKSAEFSMRIVLGIADAA